MKYIILFIFLSSTLLAQRGEIIRDSIFFTTAESLGKIQSPFIAGFADDGTITSYRIARDTVATDLTLFSVGTVLRTCQEYNIVTNLNPFAPSDMEIRFPDAAEEYRGKKIRIYAKQDDSVPYLVNIRVVGGVARLFYSTSSGSAPSDQTTLSLNGTTWPIYGWYEFTCTKFGTNQYRWVLTQR